MTANTPDNERRLLPRWRTAAAAVALGELRTPVIPTPPVRAVHFEELLAEWRREPTVETAAELVSSGWALNRLAEVDPAARLLERDGADATPLLRDLSRLALVHLLQPGNAKETPPQSANSLPQVFARIAVLKRRTRRTQRNPIAWMDLAHAHTIVGQHEKASSAVRVALALAPENRFVLRSAARYFVHAHDIERAVSILRKASSIRTDPWIMSAEIAVSTVAGKPAQSYKRARTIIEADSLDPWHTGELHGAFGTLALIDRGVGKARKFFVKSLRNPTENAIAQAQWAANGNVALEIPERLLTQARAFEAVALKARKDRRWQDALTACRRWSEMEPTSSRPLVMGAFIAEVALNDGHAALEFTNRLLVTMPSDDIALNNHIVALAYAGRQQEAEEYFVRLSGRSLTEEHSIVRRATEGLVAFRGGNLESGQRLYLEAFDRAVALSDRRLSALVIWHLLREAARAGLPEIEETCAELWKVTKDIDLPELAEMHAGIEAQLAVNNKRAASITNHAHARLPPLPPGHVLHFTDRGPRN